MQMIGCDLHARQQTLAILDTSSGVVEERVLEHNGDQVREYYRALEGPVRVGIEATGSMQWFLELMEELGVECQVGHPAKIRAAEPPKQKHDRRDALLLLRLLREDRFPSIWMPSVEQRDVRELLLYRHPVGADSDASAERDAVDRLEPRSASRRRVVEQGRLARPRIDRLAGLLNATSRCAAALLPAATARDR